MINKVHLLHEAIPLEDANQPGEVDVFSNADKPTQRVKENEQTEICVLNNNKKIKSQKNSLMKDK